MAGPLRAFCALLLTGLVLGCIREDEEFHVSGRVERERAHLGSRAGGRVQEVLRKEGDSLSPGDALLTLESTESEAGLAAAIARAASKKADLDLLLAGTRKEMIAAQEALVAARRAEASKRAAGYRPEEIAEAEAELADTQSIAENTARERRRMTELFEKGASDDKSMRAAMAADDSARARVSRAEARVSLLKAGFRTEDIAIAHADAAAAEAELERMRNGARAEEIAAANAALAAAEADVQLRRENLREMTVTTRTPGVIDTMDINPGDLIRSGQTVAIINLEGAPYVRCFIPVPRVGDFPVGRPVSIRVDGIEGKRFPGTVTHLAGESEFTPRNVQTTEKRAELVFEAKIAIGAGGETLHAGMFADVYLAGPGSP